MHALLPVTVSVPLTFAYPGLNLGSLARLNIFANLSLLSHLPSTTTKGLNANPTDQLPDDVLPLKGQFEMTL